MTAGFTGRDAPVLREQLSRLFRRGDVIRSRHITIRAADRLPADEPFLLLAVASRPRRRDRRRRAHRRAASGDRAGIAIEDAIVLAELLATDGPCRTARPGSWRAASTAAPGRRTRFKLGGMEKDATIPIQAHFDLMIATFRKLAEPI